MEKIFAQTPLPEPIIDKQTKSNDIMEFLEKIPALLIPLAGVLFVFALLYYGFLFLTSEGNSEVSQKAKKGITWSVAGIIIVAIAAAFVDWTKASIFGK